MSTKKKFNVPKILDGWKIGELLGEGACGGVYIAERNEVKGAIKIVKQKKIVVKRNQVNFASMIAQESLLLNKIKNLQIPYLPQLYQKFTVGPDGLYFIVIELFLQGSLYDLMQRVEKPLPAPLVFAIGWRLVKCLRALHQAGWLHLDMKPSNIMITDDCRRGIALIDFGLAIPIHLTKVLPRQTVYGTYAFIGSHVWDLERESARDDLEAVGLIMAWMLLGGKLPWTGDDPAMMQKKIQDPDLPQHLSNLSGHAVIGDFLLAVRKLQVDDDPGYDELLSLLEMNSGCYRDSLDWPESKSSETRPTNRTENSVLKIKRTQGTSDIQENKKTKV